MLILLFALCSCSIHLDSIVLGARYLLKVEQLGYHFVGLIVCLRLQVATVQDLLVFVHMLSEGVFKVRLSYWLSIHRSTLLHVKGAFVYSQM